LNKYLILISILVVSCKYTQTSFDKVVVSVIVDEDITPRLKSGSVELVESKNSKKLYKITFDEVRGGETYLLNRKLKESDGYNTARLKIFMKEELEKELSINELTKGMQQLDSIVIRL